MYGYGYNQGASLVNGFSQYATGHHEQISAHNELMDKHIVENNENLNNELTQDAISEAVNEGVKALMTANTGMGLKKKWDELYKTRGEKKTKGKRTKISELESSEIENPTKKISRKKKGLSATNEEFHSENGNFNEWLNNRSGNPYDESSSMSGNRRSAVKFKSEPEVRTFGEEPEIKTKANPQAKSIEKQSLQGNEEMGSLQDSKQVGAFEEASRTGKPVKVQANLFEEAPSGISDTLDNIKVVEKSGLDTFHGLRDNPLKDFTPTEEIKDYGLKYTTETRKGMQEFNTELWGRTKAPEKLGLGGQMKTKIDLLDKEGNRWGAFQDEFTDSILQYTGKEQPGRAKGLGADLISGDWKKGVKPSIEQSSSELSGLGEVGEHHLNKLKTAGFENVEALKTNIMEQGTAKASELAEQGKTLIEQAKTTGKSVSQELGKQLSQKVEEEAVGHGRGIMKHVSDRADALVEGKGGFVNDMKDRVMDHVNTQFEEAVVETKGKGAGSLGKSLYRRAGKTAESVVEKGTKYAGAIGSLIGGGMAIEQDIEDYDSMDTAGHVANALAIAGSTLELGGMFSANPVMEIGGTLLNLMGSGISAVDEHYKMDNTRKEQREETKEGNKEARENKESIGATMNIATLGSLAEHSVDSRQRIQGSGAF